MNTQLNLIKTKVYDNCNLQVSNFELEIESQEYDACRFDLNEKKVICRNAKQTPKKIGQFVTFWKRNTEGTIEPFHKKDDFDFFVINVSFENKLAQFVFPHTILRKQGIISTESKEGKRAFRVYPNWDKPNNKQAIKTQAWQLAYFYDITAFIDLQQVQKLYNDL